MKRFIKFIFFFSIFICCFKIKAIKDNSSIGEEYKIYSVIIDSLYSKNTFYPNRIKYALVYYSTIAPIKFDKFKFYTNSGSMDPREALIDSTSNNEIEHFKYYLKSTNWDQIWSNFQLNNNKHIELIETEFTCKIKVLSLSADDINFIKKPGNIVLKNILIDSLKYISNSLISFSRVGFNENNNEAIVFFSWGESGGFAEIYAYLIKKESTWCIKHLLLNVFI